ncbi:ATP-binding cassette transporter snq2 [Kluyveromyces marxianus]|nr:ATP-binding cassette transporter snq2 [Kluyveromyces marxianus]
MFWRDVDYLMAKSMLYISSGLFIGFTFYNVGTSYVGLQNAMFAAFMACIVSAPAMNQIQSRALQSRELYEVRESRSNMFHWSCLLITQYITELPYQLWCSTLFFVSFYFPLRAEYTSVKAGLFFLNYCVMFQLYCVGFGLAVLYMSPDLPSSSVIMGLLLSFMISFCGVVQPVNLMPGFWTFMWKVSPYTYFIQNLVSFMLHNKEVKCTKKELSYFEPPSGETCGSYMKSYLSSGFGYVQNPDANTNCAYCRYKVGDEYLSFISASYNNIWRNFGFLWVYICFNIFAMVALYYIFSVKRISPRSLVERTLARFKKNKT